MHSHSFIHLLFVFTDSFLCSFSSQTLSLSTVAYVPFTCHVNPLHSISCSACLFSLPVQLINFSYIFYPQQNYGDESDARGLVNPNVYANVGVYEQDFFQARPQEQVGSQEERLSMLMILQTLILIISFLTPPCATHLVPQSIQVASLMEDCTLGDTRSLHHRFDSSTCRVARAMQARASKEMGQTSLTHIAHAAHCSLRGDMS